MLKIKIIVHWLDELSKLSKHWHANRYFAVYVLQALGGAICLYFLWHVPSTGLAIAVLGTVAAIMTLRGKMGDRERTAWMILVFALLLIEIRAIKDDREKQNENFRAIGEGIKGAVAESHTQFLATLKTQNDLLKLQSAAMQKEEEHFTATLREQVVTARQDNTRFAQLLQEQGRIIEGERELIAFEHGRLLPDTKTVSLAALDCAGMHVDGRDYFIKIGSATFIVEKFPFLLLIVRGRPAISVLKDDNQNLVLVMDVTNRDGTLLMRSDDNGFVVSPSLIKTHPDKSTLLVLDSVGKVAFRAQYMNQHTLFVEGEFILGQQVARIGKLTMEGGCNGHMEMGISIN